MPKGNKAKEKTNKQDSFEATLWQAADKLRKNIDAGEYKHIALGLIFLKYISDAFEDLHSKLVAGKGEYEGADPEDPNEYTAEKVFFVPPVARWKPISDNARKTEILLDNGKKVDIGGYVDEAMEAIERRNPSLKGVLPKVYARQNLDPASLGGLIDLVGTIALGTEEAKSKDVLGQVYEYFLGQFALAEGKKGGQFYTPRSVVKLLVEMLEPYEGRVFDPCCGSGGMFVQSEKFIAAHQDHYKKKGKGVSNPADLISIYGQESNQTTWRLAKMNLAIRGIDSSNIKWNNEGSFLNDAHKDLKADFIIANPPFNDSDWSGNLLKDDARWKYGIPPAGNANYAWIQHFIYHLSPTGLAGIVLADSSMNTTSADESEIRKNIVKAGLVDCMVSMPSHLFSNTQITACLWFIARDRTNHKYRNRQNEVLFMDASKLGTMLKRKNRVLAENAIKQISNTYHNWRNPTGDYKDVPCFCKSVEITEIESNNYVLAPNRYISMVEHRIELGVDLNAKSEADTLKKMCSFLSDKANKVEKAIKSSEIIQIGDVTEILYACNALKCRGELYYNALIKKYFLDVGIGEQRKEDSSSNHQNLPENWELKFFRDLFVERKTTVKELGYCPPICSVTNLGIQLREGKYTKELSKTTSGYKVAFRGDMVFGLSREIPNLDVLREKQGAFSPAYIIYMPKDIRIGLIVGTIMRLKLMEQTDILKGGAREGRGLDKDKLATKLFAIPPKNQLDMLWGITS